MRSYLAGVEGSTSNCALEVGIGLVHFCSLGPPYRVATHGGDGAVVCLRSLEESTCADLTNHTPEASTSASRQPTVQPSLAKTVWFRPVNERASSERDRPSWSVSPLRSGPESQNVSPLHRTLNGSTRCCLRERGWLSHRKTQTPADQNRPSPSTTWWKGTWRA